MYFLVLALWVDSETQCKRPTGVTSPISELTFRNINEIFK